MRGAGFRKRSQYGPRVLPLPRIRGNKESYWCYCLVMILPERLIAAAPLPDAVKEEYMATFADLPYEKQHRIVVECWKALRSWFHTDVKRRRQTFALEMALGERSYHSDDIRSVHRQVIAALLPKLTDHVTVDDLHVINHRLE
jgi:hypothetical protein